MLEEVKVAERLKDIGRYGFGEDGRHGPVGYVLGLENTEMDVIKSMLIEKIKMAFDREEQDILLMKFGLLEGYQDEYRRRRYVLDSGFMYEDERQKYEMLSDKKSQKKVLDKPLSRLNKQELDLIDLLAGAIVKDEDKLAAYAKEAPMPLVYPKPNFLTQKATGTDTDGSVAQPADFPSDDVDLHAETEEQPKQARSLQNRLSAKPLAAIILMLTVIIGVAVYVIYFTTNNGNAPNSNAQMLFDNKQNFVQVSEYSLAGIENCVWLDEVQVERGKQYAVRVFVRSSPDESQDKVAEATNVTLQLSTDQPSGTFVKSTSVKGIINFDGAVSPVENTAVFHSNEPFSLEFIEGTGKYLCGGMTSLDPRGVSVSDDVFLREEGALLGYTALDGKIQSGDQYAGYFTILLSPQFETKLSSSWGPPRELFDLSQAISAVRFNSILDYAANRDETKFAQIKRAEDGEQMYSDSMTLQPGQEYELRIFYNNNATRLSDTEQVNFAKNVRMSVALPSVIRKNEEIEAMAAVSAENAEPQEVWASVVLANHSAGDILLRYVSDSAKIYNTGQTNAALLDSNALFSEDGVLLGYDHLDGVIPSGVVGKGSFGGYVTFRIIVDQPGFEVKTYYRKTLDDNWSETIEATAGDMMWCMIEYENTGTIQQNDVVVKNRLPAGVHYVEGSSHLRNATNPNQLAISDGVTNEGINIGNYAPNASALVWFQVRIDADVSEQNGTKNILNIARVEINNGSKESRQTIQIVKE